MITSPPDPEFDEEIGRYIDTGAPQQGKVLSQEYPNRGPVLIDEAHNFRNINMRSKGLRDYLESGDHKVVLMSATPQNLGPMDIYRQLTLFLDDMNHGLNIEPLSLEQYFHNAQRQLAYRIDLENYQAALAAWELNQRRGEAPRKPVTSPRGCGLTSRKYSRLYSFAGAGGTSARYTATAPKSTASPCGSRTPSWATWNTAWTRCTRRRAHSRKSRNC